MSPIGTTITTTNFNSSSTPDVIGNLVIPKIRCRVVGFWVWIDLDGGTAINLYDVDGTTVLGLATIVANTRPTNASGLSFFPLDDALGPPTVTLIPNIAAGAPAGAYRIGIEPLATTLSVFDFDVNAAAMMDTYGFGQNMYLTTAKNPSGVGSWTDTTTRRCWLGLLVDQFDDGMGMIMAGSGIGMVAA